MKRKKIIARIADAMSLWDEMYAQAEDPAWRDYCKGRLHSYDVALRFLEQ